MGKVVFVLLILGLLLHRPALADDGIKIKELWINDGGHSNVVYIALENRTNACKSPSNYWQLDLAEPSMREAYSMALAAFMAGKLVHIGGRGVDACVGPMEKVQYLYITP